MRTKCLVFMMSALLLLGFSNSVSANWVTDDLNDTVNEGTVGDYDIATAKVEIYPGDVDDEFVNVCIQMDGGGSLPGIVVLEFDLDDDDITGGNGSMAGIFRPCERPAGPKMKVQPGIDLGITLMLRDQGMDAPTSWCDGCVGPGGNCFIKDTPCDGACGTADCYQALVTCQPDSGPTCYVTDLPCQPFVPLCNTCYEMTTVCTSTSSDCAVGRIKGEWYATAIVARTGVGAVLPDRGRIDPLPKGPGETEDCYKLHWARVVQNTYDAIVAEGVDPAEIFDLTKAQDPGTYAKWQVSTWLDVDFGTTENDFMNIGDLCLEITDVVPNTGLLSVEVTNGGICHQLQKRFHQCMDITAVEGNYKDITQAFGDCQMYGLFADETGCNDDPRCVWDDPKCLSCDPFGDATYDGAVNAFDFGMVKYDWGRAQFPCE